MPARVAPLVFTFALALCAPGRASAAVAVPPLTGPVVDAAGVLDADARVRLEVLCRRARAESGVQLQILVVPELGDEAIEDFSMRVAETWRIGRRGHDDGVLLTVAMHDRRSRIEVGAGIEGDLTDAESGRILRETLAPALREGRYGDGLHATAIRVLMALRAMPKDLPPPEPARGAHVAQVGAVPDFDAGPLRVFGVMLLLLIGASALAIILVFVWFMTAIGRGRFGAGDRGERAPWEWSSSGSSSSSSFDSSSSTSNDSWSGGGGSFSGGGASGSW